jgi:hypothetical protein
MVAGGKDRKDEPPAWVQDAGDGVERQDEIGGVHQRHVAQDAEVAAALLQQRVNGPW